jgi:hypothetical protein
VKRLRSELAVVIQAKTELEVMVRKTMSEKVGAVALLDKMSRAIDSLNSENDRVRWAVLGMSVREPRPDLGVRDASWPICWRISARRRTSC